MDASGERRPVLRGLRASGLLSVDLRMFNSCDFRLFQ
jgi:hypothetical protein